MTDKLPLKSPTLNANKPSAAAKLESGQPTP